MITDSQSRYVSPVVLVKKRDGDVRFCIDYRLLNKITIKKEYPMPMIEESINELKNSSVYSTLDLKSGYHQLKIKNEDRHKTAFLTKRGIFEWKSMPFGLVNAPFTFQRVMNKVCENFLYKFLIVYLDDIIIFSESPEEHIKHLNIIFTTIRNVGFRLNTEKCHLLKTKIDFLGFTIAKNEVRIPDNQKHKISTWKIPKNKKDIRQFIGFCTYFKNFIPNFSYKMLDLYNCIKTNKIDDSVISSIESMKNCINNALPLKLPNFSKTFIIYTDASNFALGAVLTQKYDEIDYPIFFYSRKFSQSEINYTTTEKECLAIISAIKNWKHYLSNKFIIKTDHQALTWLLKNKEISQRLVRWNLFLQEYNYEVNYIKGKIMF
ncbi:Retrovirus-related Pol polyprotein from transposon [Dictyocoela muelleri]|nr:Retrovirus-related Pol polyprotein from transposon [Dictyocoela muelleri]